MLGCVRAGRLGCGIDHSFVGNRMTLAFGNLERDKFDEPKIFTAKSLIKLRRLY